jgi:hypothetical protein
MPERFRDWTYLDFYRNFDWGVPVHLYDWCGVPSTFFCQDVKDEVILNAGREILEAFGRDGRLILNVGDICSPTADIEQVIKLGRFA